MTASTEPAAPTEAAPRTGSTPGARFRRIGGGLSLLASGTLVAASLAMIPYQNETQAEYLQTGVDHTGPILWAAVVLHYGYLLLLPAALTLVHLARRGARRTSLVAMVLAGLGAGLSGIVVVDFYHVALANALPLEEAQGIVDLADGYGQGALIALPSMLGLLVGTNLAMFAAWRARMIPLLPVLVTLVGFGIFLFASGDAWLPTIGGTLAAIGLGWAGTIVLKMRDETWDRI
ncbi:hypothetical protein [Geodermatophilus sp. CPCC 206100]|uniref:hypothetical protein n=1 Tax=Geodermatophilus sp. CPCC 206100 TaxID=3020054 RepID=UPI003B0033C1